ncbi:MAG: Ldh family oxidoreductase [Bacteroidales bacterium]
MNHNRYQYRYLYGHIQHIFTKMGCSEADAHICASVLLSADLRGIPSHGIGRLKEYYLMWQKSRINTSPAIRVTHELPTTAVMDADRSFGAVSGIQAMDLAIQKAQDFGSAWISVRNSTHFGIAGYYAMQALEHDMIGICMTNANPLVAPTFSIERMLGTNPIAVAVPANKYPPFVADFATSPIARGKLAIKEREGEAVPYGFVQDPGGNPSTDPGIITRGGSILPLGSDYEHGSHKGYCMSAIADIFSAVLSRANFGPFVPPQVAYLKEKEHMPGKGLGHFFGVMRIDGFQPPGEFKAYMDHWIKTFKESRPLKGQNEVLVPGEPEYRCEKEYRDKGIPVAPAVIKEINEIYQKLDPEFSL